jgi:hypothetical protein
MASKSLGTLTLDLVAKIGGYTAPLDKAKRKTKSDTKDMSDYAKNVGIAFAAAGTAAAAGLAALVVSTANSANEMKILSGLANTNTADFQKLTYAAKTYGVEQDKVADILKDTSDKVGDFLTTGGGPLADFFEKIAPQIGVTADQFRNLSGSDALQLYVSSLEKANLSQSEMVFFMEAIASDSTKLLPVLKNNGDEFRRLGDEAERLGAVLDEDAIAASQKFNQNMVRLQGVVTGLGNRITSEALPAMVEFTDTLNDPAVQDGLATVASGLVAIAGAAVKTMSAVGDFGKWIGEEIAVMVGGVGDWDLKRQEELLDELVALQEKGAAYKFLFATNYQDDDYLAEQIELQRKHVEGLREQQKAEENIQKSRKANQQLDDMIGGDLFAMGSAASIGEIDTSGMLSRLKEIEDAAHEAATSQIAAYEQQIALTGDVTELERVRYAVVSGALVGINEQQQERLEQLAAEIDAMNASAEAQREIVALREQFAQISQSALEAEGDLMAVENARYAAQKSAIEEQMELLREKGEATIELEAEYQKAVEDQESEHQNRLKAIRDKAEQDELIRKQVQLAGAESLFGALGDLTETFGKKQSGLRKALLIAEKASAIASATIAIQEGIANAASLKFPANIAAMGVVASQTAGLIGTIQGVSVAHGGLDYVPKETTYLLDKGERVVSPAQNRDLTNFLNSGKSSGSAIAKVEVINNGQPVSATAQMDGETMRIVLTAVDNHLRDDLHNGRGVWREGKEKYGWPTRGAI